MDSRIQTQYDRIVGLKSDMVNKIIECGGTSSPNHTFAQIAVDLQTIVNPSAVIDYGASPVVSDTLSIADAITILVNNRKSIAQSIIDLGGTSSTSHTFAQLVDDIGTLAPRPAPTSIYVTAVTQETVLPGESIQLSATVYGSSHCDDRITWVSMDQTHAVVVGGQNHTATVTGVSASTSKVEIRAVSVADPTVYDSIEIAVGDWAAEIRDTGVLYQYFTQNTNSACWKVTSGQSIMLLKDSNEQYSSWAGPYAYQNNTDIYFNKRTVSKPTFFLGNTSGSITLRYGLLGGSIDATKNSGTGSIYVKSMGVPGIVYTSTRSWIIENSAIGEIKAYGGNSVGRTIEIFSSSETDSGFEAPFGYTTRVGGFSTYGSSPYLQINVHGGCYFKTDLSEYSSFVHVKNGEIVQTTNQYHPEYIYKVKPYISWIAAYERAYTSRMDSMKTHQKPLYLRKYVSYDAILQCTSEGNKKIHCHSFTNPEKYRIYCEVSTTQSTTYKFIVTNVSLPAGSIVTLNLNGIRGTDSYSYGQVTTLSCTKSSNTYSFNMPRAEQNYTYNFTLDTALDDEDLDITLTKLNGSQDTTGNYHYISFESADIKI